MDPTNKAVVIPAAASAYVAPSGKHPDGGKRLPTLTVSTRVGAILTHPFAKFGRVIILLQALYALFVPIKNVIVIPYPAVSENGVRTAPTPYVGMNSPNDTMPSFTGNQIVDILKRMLDLTLGNTEYYTKLRAMGGLHVDKLLEFVTADEFALIAQYISLVHQKAEFPGGRSLVRDEDVVFFNASSGANYTRTFRCREQDKFLPGTRCMNSDNELCLFLGGTPNPKLERVELDRAPFADKGSGWHNNIALSALIGNFHDALRGVFGTQDWTQTYKAMLSSLSQQPQFTPDDKLFLPWAWLPNFAMTEPGQNKIINSCAATEMLYANGYVMEFALALVDDYLRPRRLFQADKVNFTANAVVPTRMKQALEDKYVITLGVKLLSNTTTKTKLFGYTLTTLIETKASTKPFRPLDGPLLMGDSVQMLRRLVQANLMGWVNVTQDKEKGEDMSQVSLGGSWFSGLQCFKNDWTTQSSSVYKLRERSSEEGPGLGYNLFDRYEAYEDWYVKFDQTSPLSVSTYATPYIGNDANDYVCHQAMVGSLARLIWVAIANHFTFATFLQYQWKLVSGDYQNWYVQQLNHVFEMVGENSAGMRTGVPYAQDPAFVSRVGPAWPVFPVLAALSRNFTENDVVGRLMPSINFTWTRTQSAYYGNANYFDMTGCNVGLAIDSVEGAEVFYPRLYPAVEVIVRRMIQVAPEITDLMSKDVAPIHLHPHSFTGGKTYNAYAGQDISKGAPHTWEHNALQLGLTKMIGFQFPTREVFRKSMEPRMTCFDTIEVRFLKPSVRCYTEYNALTITRTEKVSTLLKMLLTTNWAHGVVLNLMGAYAALRFLQSLVRVYKCTGFKDVNSDVAMNMFIMGPDTLRVSELSVLAVSNLPLLLGYHLPANPGFVEAGQQPNYWVAQVIVALSLTWFIRLGVEAGRRLVHLKYPSVYYEAAMSRGQYLLLLIVFIVRACIPEVNGDYDRGVAVLLGSVVLSTLLGVLLILLTTLMDKRPAVMTPLDEVLLEYNVPRNWIGGCLSRSTVGWHVSGMVFEDWHVGGELLRFGRKFAIPIEDAVRPYLAKLPVMGAQRKFNSKTDTTKPTDE